MLAHDPDVLVSYGGSASNRDIVQGIPANGRPRVVACGVDGDEQVLHCAEGGVAGFVDRVAGLDELIATMLSVAQDEAACPPRITAVLLRHVAAARDTAPTEDPGLTFRERQVIALIDEGLSNKEIARQLGIEVSTVKNHVHHLLGKLGAKRRGEAAARARRALLGRPTRRPRFLVGLLALLGAASWLTAACEEPMPPPSPCTTTVGGRCWVYLGPEDVFVNAVAEVDDELWIGTATRGILRYDPWEHGWDQLAFPRKNVRSIVVVRSAGVIWATVSGAAYPDTSFSYVYVSTSGGETWEPRDGGLAAYNHFGGGAGPFAIDPLDPQHLLLRFSGGVALSEDGGATWKNVLSTARTLLGYNAVGISAADGRRAWVGGSNLTYGYQLTLRSDDGGRTWEETVPPHPQGYGGVAAFLPDPDDVDVVLASSYGSVQLTRDGGATWRNVLDLAHDGAYVYAVAATDTMLVAVSDEWLSDWVPGVLGVYTAPELAGPWTAVPTPAEAAAGFSVMVDRNGQLVIGTDRGVWLVRE